MTFCCVWMGYDDGFQLIEFQEGLSSGPCLDFKWMRSPSTKRRVICVLYPCLPTQIYRYTHIYARINK